MGQRVRDNRQQLIAQDGLGPEGHAGMTSAEKARPPPLLAAGVVAPSAGVAGVELWAQGTGNRCPRQREGHHHDGVTAKGGSAPETTANNCSPKTALGQEVMPT